MTAVQTSNPVHDAEGAVEAGIHEVGATIDAVEREVGRGVSTRFPLNSAFIFTVRRAGRHAVRLRHRHHLRSLASHRIRFRPVRGSDRVHHIIRVDRFLRGSPVHRRAVRSFRPQEAADSGGDTVPARFGHVRGIHGIPDDGRGPHHPRSRRRRGFLADFRHILPSLRRRNVVDRCPRYSS